MRVAAIRKKPLAVLLLAVVVGFVAWRFLGHLTTATEPELRQLAERYVKAIYARDFASAYQLLSTRDREAKSVDNYVKEQGAFTGYTAQLAAKLATFIEVAADRPQVNGDRASLTTRLKLPDVEKLAPLVLGWDEENLNALSADKQAALLATIDARRQKAELPFIETDEKFEFVRENNRWRLWLDWRASVQVNIQIKLPADAPLEVAPLNSPLRFQPGEPFTIALKLKNPTANELRARVVHNVEPKSLEKYLGVGDCGTFVPFRLGAGKEDENKTTFLVWTNLPAEIKRFTMIYEFEVDRQTP